MRGWHSTRLRYPCGCRIARCMCASLVMKHRNAARHLAGSRSHHHDTHQKRPQNQLCSMSQPYRFHTVRPISKPPFIAAHALPRTCLPRPLCLVVRHTLAVMPFQRMMDRPKTDRLRPHSNRCTWNSRKACQTRMLHKPPNLWCSR